MREYTHTTTIEELQKLIAKGLAKPDEVERWTADPPILPSWKVVELELSDVPEFIQGHGSIRFNELELESPWDNYTTQTGERIDFSIPSEVAQEISRQITAQHKADYFANVEQEFTKLKNGLLTKLQDSPDPERGRLNVIERWERILEGRDTDGLQRTEINLRTAWADITEGIRYIGEQKHRDRRKAMQMAAPPHLANYRNLVWHERQVDNQLRAIYINAEAAHRFLQWLKELPQANKPEMIAGQAFAFTDGKLIEKHPLQTIVEYFNEEGAEVQLFTTGNDLALLSLDATELEAVARHKADPSELQALFNLKFSQARDSGKGNDPQAFAKAEGKRLLRAWADDADLFPIAGQWLQFLRERNERTVSGSQTDKLSPSELILRMEEQDIRIERAKRERAALAAEPVAPPSTPPQGSEGGTGAENRERLTSWQAAYLLAYKRKVLEDPRNRGENADARIYARDLCKLTADNSGYQLYQRTTYLRRATDREAFFNSAKDAFDGGESYHGKSPKSFLNDIETIIPLLEGEQKSEAEKDLKRWNAMI